MSNLLQNWFSDRAFYVNITDPDTGLKVFHTLFDKYLDHMLLKFEQKRIIQNIHNFRFFGKKMVSPFWESVDAILKDASVTKTVVRL